VTARVPEGWHGLNTGGGCTAWVYRDGPLVVCATDDDGNAPAAPTEDEPEGARLFVGLYVADTESPPWPIFERPLAMLMDARLRWHPFAALTAADWMRVMVERMPTLADAGAYPCRNCETGDMGKCPVCWTVTERGCPHGEVCAECESPGPREV
jgi:hypothetical protein